MNVLIIKENRNAFEKFVTKQLGKYATVVPVYGNYSFASRGLRKIQKKIPILNNYLWIWFGKWRQQLLKYDKIIIFDISMEQELIDYVIKKPYNNRFVLWFWNSFEQLPVDFKSLRACSFDKRNCERFNFRHVEQFYFDIVPILQDEYMNDIFFIGEDKGRLDKIREIASILVSYNLTCNIKVKTDQKNEKDKNIQYIDQMYPYEEVISNIQESKCILEICKTDQIGLSLRALEALFFKKKLITNNQEISQYDFYNKNNIFIIGVDDINQIVEFVNGLFEPVDSSILKKYSIDSWINEI